MQLDHEIVAGNLVFRVQGELDLNTAERFRLYVDDAMDRHRCYQAVLNLRKVTFVDSSGLGAIIGRYRRIAQRQGTISIVSPPPHVLSVLELSGIKKIIPVYSSEQKALAPEARMA